VTATAHGAKPATGPTVTSATGPKRVEKKQNEEEAKRHVELRRAQDQLKKCLEDVDYMGAAAVKEKIAALMSAAPSFEKEEEEEEKRHQAEHQLAQHQLKKCLEDVNYLGAAAINEKVAVLMSAAPSVEKEEEDEEEE
jgi:DNA relaxase NicK